MKSIKDIYNQSPPKEKIEKSERAQIVKEIYALYTSPTQNRLRKIENWKRYVRWCKENSLKIKVNVNVEKFKKHRDFIQILPIRAFCVKISHLKEKDLHYVLSESKDRNRRELSIASFLLK